jgi:hypothetical protein
MEQTCGLTVKLRGRPEAPDQASRAHNLFRARGAQPLTVHGPLQRLLEDAINQPTTARMLATSNEGSLAPVSQLFMSFKMSLGCGL